MTTLCAQDIIRALGLTPHPEGGHYAETFRDAEVDASGRAHGTAIYYLLQHAERSHWHRVDAAEIWFWHAGAPLTLSLSAQGEGSETHTLGPALDQGQRPQAVVPKGHWQSAQSLGDWTLVSCTVAPGFEFSGFEMAPPGWEPASR